VHIDPGSDLEGRRIAASVLSSTGKVQGNEVSVCNDSHGEFCAGLSWKLGPLRSSVLVERVGQVANLLPCHSGFRFTRSWQRAAEAKRHLIRQFFHLLRDGQLACSR